MKKLIVIIGCLVWLGTGSRSFADSTSNLVYTPVTPCRIIDTRIPNSPITTTPTNFVVTGTTGFEAQGGQAGGCGIPVDAAAVSVNFIAVSALGPGNFRAWPFGIPEPTYCSIINYAAVTGLNVANGVVEPLCDPAVTTCTSHLVVRANGASAHLVADVSGYFSQPKGEAITVNCPGQSLQAAVDAGYPGDVINVTGTCNENVVIREEKQRITLDGGNVAQLQGASSTSNVLSIRGTGIVIRNFEITGGFTGIYAYRGSSAVIINNNIHNTNAHGIQVNQSSSAVIRSNNIHNNPYDGIYVGENSNARIGFDSFTDSAASPNTIQSNGGRGITVTQTAHAAIVGNTITDNGSDGIGVLRLSQANIASNTINHNGLGASGGNGINVSQNSGIELGEDNPTNFFGQPNTTTVNNVGYGINCGMGAYVRGHLGSSNQIMGSIGQTTSPWPGSCPQSLVIP